MTGKYLLLALLATAAFAQDPVSITPYQLIDARAGNAIACSNCSIYTYAAGTNTPLATYTSSTLATPNTNPVLTNSAGYAVNGATITGIWVGSSCYKFVAKDSSAVTLFTQDNICDRGAVLKALLAASGGAGLVGYSQTTSYANGTVGARLKRTITVTDPPYNVVATGADQSTAFQLALDAVNSTGGGVLFIPYNSSCYVVANMIVYSNTTVMSDSQATCVKALVGPTAQTFRTNPGATNVHFSNFTIDGNRANQVGIVGDGGNFNIYFASCSNCSMRNMVSKNAYTDNVLVGKDAGASIGTGVQIANNRMYNSRRNNISVTGGLYTTISGNEISGATGGSLTDGIDIEPDVSGNNIDGLLITGNNVYGNTSHGIDLNIKDQTIPARIILSDNNSHDNTLAGLYAVDFNSSSGGTITAASNATAAVITTTGTAPATAQLAIITGFTGAWAVVNGVHRVTNLSATTYSIPYDTTSLGAIAGTPAWTVRSGALKVVSGTYTSAAYPSGMTLAGWNQAVIGNVIASGLTSGISIASNNADVVIGDGALLSGSVADLAFDGALNSTRTGDITLAHNTTSAGGGPLYVNVVGLYADYAANSLAYTPFTGIPIVKSSSRLTVNDSATNPAIAITDGTAIQATGIVNTSGTFGRTGTITSHDFCVVSNNNSSYGICMDTTGTHPYFKPGLPVYANNAAAIAGGLTTAGMVYRITGTDTVGVVW